MKRTLLCSLVALLLCSAGGRAQQLVMSFVLDVDPSVLPAESVRSAIEADLGTPVTLGTEAPKGGSLLSVRPLRAGVAIVTLRDESGRSVAREVTVPDQGPDSIETVALIASNLVQDETAGLLAQLAQQNAAAVPLEPAPPPTSPLPEAPVVARPEPTKLERPFDPCSIASTHFLGVDFFPGIGLSSTQRGRDAVRHFSLNAIGGRARGLHGAELAIGFNHERSFMCGAQAAVGANIVSGPVRGIQLAAGLNLAMGPLTGLQLGNVNVGTDHVSGIQAGEVNWARGLRGTQLGVLDVSTADVHGAQLSVLNVAVGDVTGAQLAVVNVALKTFNGAQLGVVNYAGSHFRGAQVGVVNVSEDARAPIGLLSIVRRGRTTFDAWGAENGVIMGGVSHGGDIVHNLYYAGIRLGSGGPRSVFALGLGARVLTRRVLRIDVDALAEQHLRDISSPPLTMVSTLRVPFTFNILGSFGLMLAPSYHVMITEDAREKTQAVVGEATFHKGATRVLGYPGLALGVRFELDGTRKPR